MDRYLFGKFNFQNKVQLDKMFSLNLLFIFVYFTTLYNFIEFFLFSYLTTTTTTFAMVFYCHCE